MYVDDIIITASNLSLLSSLISRLSSQFLLKNLSRLSYFLGVQASFSTNDLHLCQQKYVFDLLTRVGMTDCKPISISMAFGTSLSINDGEPLPNLTEIGVL